MLQKNVTCLLSKKTHFDKIMKINSAILSALIVKGGDIFGSKNQ